MSAHIKILIVIALLLAILLGVLSASWYFYRNAHVKVDGVIYERSLRQLDLRGQSVTVEQYLNLKESLPNCEITWDVPFQDTVYPDDTTEISVTTLSEEDMKRMQYLPKLQKVDATACFDYAAVQALMEAHPDWQVDYNVRIDGQVLFKDTQSIAFPEGRGNYDDLMNNLVYLPQVQEIHFDEPALKSSELTAIREKYPNIQITWMKTVFGEKRPDDTKELDISGTKFTSISQVEEQAAYLPGLEKLTMCDTGLKNDDIAGFRERVRGKCKVIWNVQVGRFNVRTDETWFMPTKFHMDIKDVHAQNLKYCEDMICVDLGHNMMKNIEWVKGMPHLQYLIIADCPLQDVTPIGTLKELKFLELFMTDIRDISPIVGCTALEDLNVARIPADLTPLAEMKWLKNLWASGGRVSKKDAEFLRQQLPNTRIDTSYAHDCTGRGWRESQNYKDMRKILDMPLFQ